MLTYSELITDVEAWASELRANGVRRGDRIGIGDQLGIGEHLAVVKRGGVGMQLSSSDQPCQRRAPGWRPPHRQGRSWRGQP